MPETTPVPSTTPTNPPVLCGEPMEGPSGVIQSPNWPGNYPSNHMCEWAISCEDGATPELTVNWGDVKNMAIEWESDAKCR